MEDKEASIKAIIGKAEEAERNKDSSSAIKWYKEVLQHDDLCIQAYDRLMKLYRQSKEYKNELAVINKAIKAYEAYYRKHRPKHSKTISDLSEKLNKAFGLVDKKGIKTYQPEPIGKWLKRKAVVEKKLK